MTRNTTPKGMRLSKKQLAEMAVKDTHRRAIRELQDAILTEAEDRNYPYSTLVSTEIPGLTLGNLISCIYPQWENELRRALDRVRQSTNRYTGI